MEISNWVPYLYHPLVLVGFALFLFFGLCKHLIKSRIIPPVSRSMGGKLLTLLLQYGFIISLTIAVLGIALRAWEIYEKSQIERKKITDETAQKIAAMVAEKLNPPPKIKEVIDELRQLRQEILADVDRAEVEYKKAIKLYEKGKYLEAIQYLKSSLTILPQTGAFLFTLSNLYYEINNYPLSEDYAKKAMKKYRDMGKEDYVAALKINLGVLYRRTQRLDEAEESYREALEAYRRFAEKDPEYQRGVATILNNLAVIYKQKDRLDDALEVSKEALEIRRKFAKKNPEVYLPELAMALNTIGAIYDATNRSEEAEISYQESLKIYRRFADKNSNYLPLLAIVLMNHAIFSASNSPNAARTEIDNSIEIMQKLTEKNPEKFKADMIKSLQKAIIFYYFWVPSSTKIRSYEIELNKLTEKSEKARKQGANLYLLDKKERLSHPNHSFGN